VPANAVGSSNTAAAWTNPRLNEIVLLVPVSSVSLPASTSISPVPLRLFAIVTPGPEV
jgi:hypothetical protein